ncbi:MAG TPA: hypothetical protein VFR14_01925 [Candidatus Limnocylindrales bacterium]|nr:hypothetical protein [Candidatus Limnocylindrales bacterium]
MNDRTRTRRGHAGSTTVRVGGWLSAGLLAAVATFGPAPRAALGAVTVTPVISGNPTCASFAPTGSTWSEFRLQDARLADGTYSDGTLTVTISGFAQSGSGTPGSFDWSSNVGVDAVFVKAGSDKHNLYRYAPEATSGEDLGPQAGKGNGISHISFCYDADQAPTDDPTTPPTEDPTEPPTDDPTTPPTEDPTEDPTTPPTEDPTEDPTTPPTEDPTDDPSPDPIQQVLEELPTDDPTDEPSTDLPTDDPTETPSNDVPATDPPTESSTEAPTSPPSQSAVLADAPATPGTPGPSATPHVGAVLAVQGTPTVTLPPTDTVDAPAGGQADGWRIILLGLALIIAALLLTTVPAQRRR